MSQNQRLFIAIELPTQLQKAVGHVIEQLQQQMLQPHHVRWVPPKNLHLTLKFLGDTHPSQIPRIQATISALAKQYDAFQLGLNKLGIFPNFKKPRVLWLGITSTDKVLLPLKDALENEMEKLGFNADDKLFRPHLTIGRVKQHIRDREQLKAIAQVVQDTENFSFAPWECRAISLMKSDLTQQGAIYTQLFHANLIEKDRP